MNREKFLACVKGIPDLFGVSTEEIVEAAENAARMIEHEDYAAALDAIKLALSQHGASEDYIEFVYVSVLECFDYASSSKSKKEPPMFVYAK